MKVTSSSQNVSHIGVPHTSSSKLITNEKEGNINISFIISKSEYVRIYLTNDHRLYIYSLYSHFTVNKIHCYKDLGLSILIQALDI